MSPLQSSPADTLAGVPADHSGMTSLARAEPGRDPLLDAPAQSASEPDGSASSPLTVPMPLVRWAVLLLVVYLTAVAFLVFQPGEGSSPNAVLAWLTDLAASWGANRRTAFAVFEFLLNVVMFVPLGVLLPVILRRLTYRVVMFFAVAGLTLSLTIEFVQLFIPGRYSDPRDLLANTLGAVLGALLIVACRRLLTVRRAVSE